MNNIEEIKKQLIDLCVQQYVCDILDIEAFLDDFPDRILAVLGLTEDDLEDEINAELDRLCEIYQLNKEDYYE